MDFTKEIPTDTLVARWANHVKTGIPVYRKGKWSIAIWRGNKRVMFFAVK